MKRARVVVSGRVQGVWFRGSCSREAEALELSGWVRNNPDGTVEAVFEGPAAAVDQMIGWCEFGPPQAEVSHVEISWEPPAHEPTTPSGFRVQ